MSGLSSLVKLAVRRTEAAVLAGQRLAAQCDEASRKLELLEWHQTRYHGLVQSILQQGMPSHSILAHLNFTRQIEMIIVRQHSELRDLEEARSRQWREVVNARREQRMYEILNERATARRAVLMARQQQAERDELLQRSRANRTHDFTAIRGAEARA